MPEPVITIRGSRATEGQYVIFTVELSEPATDAVTVDFQTYSGTAEHGVDIRAISGVPTSGTVTFIAGETVKAFRIYVGSESVDEIDESFMVELSNPSGASFGPGNASLVATGWALDNDGPGLNRAISVSTPIVNEGAGNQAIFTISLSQAFDTDRSFTYSTIDGSARAGSDYAAQTGTVTFLAGQTEATVTVNLMNDGASEATESFGLAITGAHDVTGTVGTARILDTDATQPVISIEGSRATEGNFVLYTVRLSEPAPDAVTVNFQTYSGTAEHGVDVRAISGVPTSGTVTFIAGETVKTFRIYVDSESVDEIDESFMVELSNPTGASFGSGNASLMATGWALDNDGPGLNRAIAVSTPIVTEGAGNQATFTISLSEAFDTNRSFTYSTIDGSARAGSDYVAQTGTVTFLAGQTEATVTVNLLNDSASEATESFGLKVNGAHNVGGAAGTARVLDPDSAQPVISIEGSRATEGNFALYTVRLSEPATDAVTVDFQTYSGTADLGVDVRAISGVPTSGTVTFSAGETVKTFRIYVDSESLDEIDESFMVELSNPTGASFGAGNATLAATGWVLDNDGPGLNRSISVSSADIREGPGGRVAVFSVEISAPSTEEITLNFQTQNGTARAGSDYSARSGQLTFAPGQTRVEVSVPIANNLTLEANEQFYLRVVSPFPPQISAQTPTLTGTATILDGTIRGTDGNDVRVGTDFADRIEGFGGNDRLSGRGGNDIIAGGGGNDTLAGDTGTDRLQGGTGNDLYLVDTRDIITESSRAGTDTVRAGFSYTLGANVENLVLAGGGAINGTGNGLANVLTGNGGRNILAGRGGNDTYVVGTGDVVRELANQGIDTVRTGVSFKLAGHVENLVLTGGGAINGTGNSFGNRIQGNAGSNNLNGASGNDVLLGGGGHDRMIGGGGNDVMRGDTGNDILRGGLGRDNLIGSAGNDNLSGEAGADRLVGGSGTDLLAGGADRDVFIFTSIADSRAGSARDRISDFTRRSDDIDLRSIDANTRQGGNQDFDFNGNSAASNSVWYVQRGDDVLVRGDVNGNRTADFEILLSDVSTLTASDFLF